MNALKTILCIDDEEDMLAFLRQALEVLGGHRVVACNSGREGVRMAEELKPDLILLDMLMPGMDGMATLAALKSGHVTSAIPVFFITLRAEPHVAAHYIAQGASGVIAKPFDPQGFLREVAALWQSLHARESHADAARALLIQLRELRPDITLLLQRVQGGSDCGTERAMVKRRIDRIMRTQMPALLPHPALMTALAALGDTLSEEGRDPTAAAGAVLHAALQVLTFAPDTAAPSPPMPLQKKRRCLLVADDDRIVREMMVKLFAEETQLHVAADGKEAYALIEQHRPDLAVLDDMMPGMTGLRLIELLHAKPEFRHMPVLMLTGSDRPQDVMRAMQAGAVDYVTKPFSPAVLAGKVHEQLANLA